jgi:hypothetical protein
LRGLGIDYTAFGTDMYLLARGSSLLLSDVMEYIAFRIRAYHVKGRVETDYSKLTSFSLEDTGTGLVS